MDTNVYHLCKLSVASGIFDILCGFDELTDFEKNPLQKLFSLLGASALCWLAQTRLKRARAAPLFFGETSTRHQITFEEYAPGQSYKMSILKSSNQTSPQEKRVNCDNFGTFSEQNKIFSRTNVDNSIKLG